MIKIYHNPRCSKSRAALALLEEKKLACTVVEYLKNPPSAAELKVLFQKLDMPPEEGIRKNEALYKATYKDKKFTSEEWFQIISENPILLERPIVEKNYKAVIARPTEKLVALL